MLAVVGARWRSFAADQAGDPIDGQVAQPDGAERGFVRVG